MNNFTWKFSSKAAETPVDGWHRLTPVERGASSRVNLVESFDAPGQTIKMQFDYISWGGSGADGLALYLFDPSVASAGEGSFNGQLLGYINLPGAYIGIGLDEYGGYSNGISPHDGPFTKNLAVIRGSATRKWNRLASSPVKQPLSYNAPTHTTREQVAKIADGVKRVSVKFTPKKYRPGYTIDLTINSEIIFDGLDYPYEAPASLKVGLSAANGAGTNNHEIRNLQLQVSEAVEQGCPNNGNLIRGVPAFIYKHPNKFPYPFLNDGDHVHQGYDGSGPWGNALPADDVTYGVELYKSTPSSIEVNTLVIYGRQDDARQQEPSDSMIFTQHGPIKFDVLAGENESSPIYRVDLIENNQMVQFIDNNNLIKRTVTFKPLRCGALRVGVFKAASAGPSIVGLEAYNR